jgi:DNA-binding NarL/FixJ family response regulator
MDILMPGMTGPEFVRHLRKVRPPLPSRILFLTDHDDDHLVFEALKVGADGYLSKSKISIAQLSDAIRQVSSGEASITPNIARKLIENFRRPASRLEGFSDREEEVLAQLAGGLMYKEIASKLCISLNTVRQHVRSIYDKLKVQSRTQATLRYLEQTRRTQ